MRNITLATLFFGLLFSCSNHADIPVWEITKEDEPKSYLIGTIDYMDKSENGDLLNELITNKFNEATTYITQIDIKNSDFLLTKQELEIGMNQTLKDVMEDVDFDYLQNLITEFNKSKTNNLLSPDSNRTRLIFYLQDALYNNNQNNFYFEQYFMKQAMGNKKNIVGLETYQDFYRTQSQISDEEQLGFMRTIGNVESFSNDYKNNIAEAYKEGDLEKIQEVTINTFPYQKTNYANFYTKKHTFWVRAIDSNLIQEKCFITLNATNLSGRGNFIETLLSKGYKVDKIQ